MQINKAFTWLCVRLGVVAPIGTGSITENLHSVKTGIVNFYVYGKGGDYVAFDSGIGDPDIRQQLGALDIDPNRVSAVFLSHSDFDHVGGLHAFSNAAVYLSGDEEQMIAGKRARKFGVLRNKNIQRPYTLLCDDDEITIGSIIIKAIATPGHTPGSMSYLIDDSILYVGDTFTLRNGLVRPVARVLNMDPGALDGSIRKLASLQNVKLALTAHRGYTESFYEACAGRR